MSRKSETLLDRPDLLAEVFLRRQSIFSSSPEEAKESLLLETLENKWGFSFKIERYLLFSFLIEAAMSCMKGLEADSSFQKGLVLETAWACLNTSDQLISKSSLFSLTSV